MEFLQPGGLLCQKTNTGLFSVKAPLVLRFYLWRCISCRLFTFCFVPSASSLLWAWTACPFPFVRVSVGGWQGIEQLVRLWIVLLSKLLPPQTLFWANVECIFADSKSLHVHSQVIWGLHSALNLATLSMNNFVSWNVTWELRLWATN